MAKAPAFTLAMLFVGSAAALISACQAPQTASSSQNEGLRVTAAPFETLPDGRAVKKWDVRNASGAGFTVTDLGTIILTLDVPDRSGKLADVVLGFDAAAPYLTDSPYFGATVGRYANRIAKGRFTLDGQTYTLATNNAPNSLHGGVVGFDKRVWTGEFVETTEGSGVRFTLVSADGEEGFPGEVTVTTTYLWTNDNQMIVDYAASTTKPTPFNIAQHSYFNLSGAAQMGPMLDHQLMLNADTFLPIDETSIPTGERRAVAGTPFDFRTAKPVGQDIDADDEQIRNGGGYDHNFNVNGSGLRVAAVLTDPKSGRVLTVSTDQPGIQVYSGNFLSGAMSGKGGNRYPKRSGIALETQGYPDSPNQPDFPDTILRPGKPFKSRTIYAFSIAP